jgi:predicted nucleic acid-binding protein
MARASIKNLFSKETRIELLPHKQSTFEAAALLRASYKIKLPDALHIATPLENQIEVFLTNDREIPSIPEITVLQLPSS